MEQRIGSGAPWESIVGYSRAVRKGNMIWVSGTAPMDGDAVAGGGDPYAQAIACLQIIQAAIEKAGGQLSDVVRTRMFVTDISHWEAFGKAHGAFFRDIRPATTMVEVSALIMPEMLIEIEAEAYIGD